MSEDPTGVDDPEFLASKKRKAPAEDPEFFQSARALAQRKIRRQAIINGIIRYYEKLPNHFIVVEKIKIFKEIRKRIKNNKF